MPGIGGRHGPVARRVEWPTLALLVTVHGGWIGVLAMAGLLGPLVAILMLVPILVLHASLQHEVIHGHPFRDQRLNDLMGALPVGLFVPYERFRDTHLSHHFDPNLTDPYDDPETNYLDGMAWDRMSRSTRTVWRLNNTLLGRILIGPVLSNLRFWASEFRALPDSPGVRRAWALHGIGLVPVIAFILWSSMPLWAYFISAWLGAGVLRIRTFLEHQADEHARARSCIVEDRGFLAFLFLNNNLHALHHARPQLAWYDLPKAFAAERDVVLSRNGGYRFSNYREVFGRYLLRAKDPVAHPLWNSGNRIRPVVARKAAKAERQTEIA